MTKRSLMRCAGLLLGAALLAACSDRSQPTAPSATTIAPRADAARFAPAPLTAVSLGGSDLSVWPYTGDAFPATSVDPINLVFVGDYADPRQIRAALLGLGGDRSAAGLPPNPYLPGTFDCHWVDGIGGGNQTAYVEGMGWVGSVIQLTCGPYNGFRFHLRLFPFGNITLGGAHFEMNIPGTADHESLSWELARMVVVSDLANAGRLAAQPGAATMGSATPTYRSVRPEIYASPLIQLLLSQFGSTYPDIPNSGQATVLTLGQPPAAALGSNTATLTIDYGIDIPKPFCDPGDFVHVEGPVQLSQTTTVTASGDYSATFQATGLIDVTPLVGGGTAFQAMIAEVNASVFTDQVARVTFDGEQRMIPPAPGRGFQIKTLRVGPGNATTYQNQVHCYQ